MRSPSIFLIPLGFIGISQMRRYASKLVTACCCIAALAVAPVVLAQTAPPEQTASSAVESKLTKAVVRIESMAVSGAPSSGTLGSQRLGSGVVIAPNTILTIGYLILETETIQVVTHLGKKVPAVVAGYDHATGFGLLRTFVPLNVEPLILGDSDSVKREQKLLNLGQGELEVTELQVLSRKPFVGSWEYLVEQPIFTGPPVNNWSGSALATLQGELVGIGSLVVPDAGDQRGEPGNMFVPVNLLKPILADLLDKGYRNGPVQPWFGMTTDMVNNQLIVIRVAKDSPAEQAQLKRGDIIVQVNDKPVTNQADFYRQAWSVGPAGSAVEMQVKSGSDTKKVSLVGVDRNLMLKRPAGT